MLRERIITALILLLALLGAVFWLPTQGWWGVCSLVGAAAAWEWAGLFRFHRAVRWSYALIVAIAVAALAMVESKVADAALFALSALFWMLVVPPWLKQRWRLSGGPLSLLTGLIVMLPAGLALARLRAVSPWFMLAVLAVIWVADIGAYFGGRAFGKRKLAPEISPGKSWEGVYAGMLAVMCYGVTVYVAALPSVPQRVGWPVSMLALGGIAVLSILGDLFESLLKRHAGIKDSSNLLPGHGGVLDRIDSLTSTLPLAALWTLIWELTR